jgi:hypothetical protein
LAFSSNTALAAKLWTVGTIPVVAALLVSMIRKFLAGRLGVDAVAFVSMSAGLLLGEQLVAVVVAVTYAGGNTLEDLPWRAPSATSRFFGGSGSSNRCRGSDRADLSLGVLPLVTPFSCVSVESFPSMGWSSVPRPGSMNPL